MKDIIKLSDRKPLAAEGHFCIELTDPLTGKVKERVSEKNTVFLDSLFSIPSQVGYYSGLQGLNVMPLYLTDSTAAIDTLPYLKGNIIGYGLPNGAAFNNYTGAYNSSNQVLQACSLTSSRWKYQYDFTTAQGNGTIGTIGLTRQYNSSTTSLYSAVYAQDYRCMTSVFDSYNMYYTCDGRYTYKCSTAGVITKYDNYLSASSTIDVSATVGNTGVTTKAIGYAPATRTYYIIAYSATTTLRKVHVFSDNTFSTCTATYTCTNLIFSSIYTPYYVYGNYIYQPVTNNINSFDFINNTVGGTYAPQAQPAIGATTNSVFSLGTGGYAKETYIFSIPIYASGSTNRYGAVFNMATNSFVAYLKSINDDLTSNYVCYGAILQHPCFVNTAPCFLKNSSNTSAKTMLLHNNVVTAKKLDTPVVKTSANGMTVTYELEVFW